MIFNKPPGRMFYVGGPGQIIGGANGPITVAGGVMPLPNSRIDPYPMPPTHLPPFPQPKPVKIKPVPKPVMRPPITRVPPLRQLPAIQPRPTRTRPRHAQGHRSGAHYQHRRQRPTHLGPPVYVPPVEQPQPPVVIAPPIATGPPCPSWGWAVSTNPDGSETVHRCTPGQPMAAGLHGLEDLWADVNTTATSYLGPNWLLYVGGAAVAYFLLFKKRR